MGKIDVDGLANEIMQELYNFQHTTAEAVEKAVKETAKETAKELNAASPVGQTGDYAKSWSYKRDPSMKEKYRYNMVVYSKAPEYRISHLLENGHAKRNGGRVNAIVHIKPIEEQAKERLEKRILEQL